jgi:hypothetical protein
MLLFVGFEISMVVAMKIIVFSDMTPFSLENRYKFTKESVPSECSYKRRVYKIHFLRQINPLHNVLSLLLQNYFNTNSFTKIRISQFSHIFSSVKSFNWNFLCVYHNFYTCYMLSFHPPWFHKLNYEISCYVTEV